MKQTLDFYWDIGSTNSYFAFKLIQPIVKRHNAKVRWHPFNLGYVFRSNDYVLMDEPKAKMRNRLADLNRWAKFHQLPFRMPDNFPIKTSRALRAAIAMRQWDLEFEFMQSIFSAYWEKNVGTIGEYTTLTSIAEELGVEAKAFEAVCESDEVKQALIDSTNQALERGVFGAPSIYIDDELYWGKDRMEFIDAQLSSLNQ
ncbi:MAG: 2-hydroxychromene-2-carboxylate isomerase [Candidatus Azotimanducaceae bacterium]|jgi:2-hydroxychromene-2-carboxylate isomerase